MGNPFPFPLTLTLLGRVKGNSREISRADFRDSWNRQRTTDDFARFGYRNCRKDGWLASQRWLVGVAKMAGSRRKDGWMERHFRAVVLIGAGE